MPQQVCVFWIVRPPFEHSIAESRSLVKSNVRAALDKESDEVYNIV